MRRLLIPVLLILLAAPRFVTAQCAGWPGFQAPVSYSASADKVVLVRDLDGDGAPEILTSGNQVDELSAFSLLANGGDGTFAPETLIASSFGEKLEDVGDRDHDGIFAPKTTIDTQLPNGATPSVRTINGALEILAGERSGHLAILRYAGGVLTIQQLDAGPGFDLSSTFADLNGDGIADIVDTSD